jgi:hypothetical protein
MARVTLDLAPGLRSLRNVPVAFVFNGKKGCEPFVRAVAAALRKDAGVEARFWKKASPYQPMSARRAAEVAAYARAVVVGPGDCGRGSACSLLDAIQFESLHLPVAWLDTARRVPRVRRLHGRYVIEYGANRRIEAWVGGRDPSAPAIRRRLEATFERFGFHRALRLAGAAPGDILEVGSLRTQLWEYPRVSHPHVPDGIRDYAYIEIDPVVRLRPPDLEREAARVVAPIRRRLGRLRR